jgi:hypothetical protein
MWFLRIAAESQSQVQRILKVLPSMDAGFWHPCQNGDLTTCAYAHNEKCCGDTFFPFSSKIISIFPPLEPIP